MQRYSTILFIVADSPSVGPDILDDIWALQWHVHAKNPGAAGLNFQHCSSLSMMVPQVRSMAAMYGFSDQCTAVGTSYFARLAARDAR
jgi:hypothetical protein